MEKWRKDKNREIKWSEIDKLYPEAEGHKVNKKVKKYIVENFQQYLL
ncbi:MAG: hypothetical protein M1326_02950 [Cyanobacteria bacterium]|nr:hypothetical protein [Cyanobacteriota bacterium]